MGGKSVANGVHLSSCAILISRSGLSTPLSAGMVHQKKLTQSYMGTTTLPS